MEDLDEKFDLPDWKLIDEISIPLLEKGIGTYDILQSALASVVFCKADIKDENWTNARLLKMFRIAQLQLLYILQSQNELVKKLTLEKEKCKKVYKENDFFKKSLTEQETARDLFRCQECSKIFLHSSFLLDHIHRKHGSHYDEHHHNQSNGHLSVPHSPKQLSSASSNTSVWR
ncbi:unnamed protein product [Bursaphelenchus xylophilus]|uniref:(pine wood nematode) hypothetical protein n=1 Tax=Bursaphelenchus xylophilus TaxID=6326 RepID=A0A1I7SM10_BURXY|nr:unnamed protein product [Bursaphelenchus xylophilus]CAG9129956.1 unnamed protein product [Bursaphelenchus xylophilus]